MAKHTSIWNRNYQFTTLLNGAGPSKAPSKVAVKKSPKPPKRVIESIEDSDEDVATESQNDDLVLKQYMNLNQPSQKRFKEDNDDDSRSAESEENGVGDEQPLKEETTPNRNPFKKSVPSKDMLLSPTRISRETNSLVKNQSPVKHIDFSKLEKLSKFNRTASPTKKQQIVSRFFGTSVKPKCETEVKTEIASPKIPTESVAKSDPQMKSPNLLDLYKESPKSCLYFTKSNDSGFSANNDESAQKNSQYDPFENDSDENLSRETQCLLLDKFRYVLKEKPDGEQDPMECQSSQSTYTSDKTDYTESSEMPVVLSDNENDIDNSQKEAAASRMWLNGSQNTKTVRNVLR